MGSKEVLYGAVQPCKSLPFIFYCTPAVGCGPVHGRGKCGELGLDLLDAHVRKAVVHEFGILDLFRQS